MEPTALIRLSQLFPDHDVYAKCEFLAPSGSFKIRGAMHLLAHLTARGEPTPIVVPSMGNTVLGMACAARSSGFGGVVVGVVPHGIARSKEEKLQALGVELIKTSGGGGSDLLPQAAAIAVDRRGYFLHPHLDPLWTDGYQKIAEESLRALPDCGSLVFPVGGGGLLMGLTEYLRRNPSPVRLYGCEPLDYPKYARFQHARRDSTIADGLILETPHPAVQERIGTAGVQMVLVAEEEIRRALKRLFQTQGLVVEPSSAVALAFAMANADRLEKPVCIILTGGNITHGDHARHMADAEP